MVLNNVVFRTFSEFAEYKVRILSILSGIAYIPLFAIIIQKSFQKYTLTIGCVLLQLESEKLLS